MKQKDDFNIVKVVNEIGKEVSQVLKHNNEEKYFEEIMLLYSLIENLLKWTVFMKISWDRRGDKELSRKDLDNLRYFCKQLRFYDALNIGLFVELIGLNLYKEIDKVKEERTDVTHQLWIYEHRRDPVELRKTLEMLAGVASKLVKISESLGKEIGGTEIYKRRLQ